MHNISTNIEWSRLDVQENPDPAGRLAFIRGGVSAPTAACAGIRRRNYSPAGLDRTTGRILLSHLAPVSAKSNSKITDEDQGIFEKGLHKTGKAGNPRFILDPRRRHPRINFGGSGHHAGRPDRHVHAWALSDAALPIGKCHLSGGASFTFTCDGNPLGIFGWRICSIGWRIGLNAHGFLKVWV